MSDTNHTGYTLTDNSSGTTYDLPGKRATVRGSGEPEAMVTAVNTAGFRASLLP